MMLFMTSLFVKVMYSLTFAVFVGAVLMHLYRLMVVGMGRKTEVKEIAIININLCQSPHQSGVHGTFHVCHTLGTPLSNNLYHTSCMNNQTQLCKEL